jgi:hypothetical protein
MKFLIQKINGEIRHDFSFTLLEAIRFKKWFGRDKITYRFLDTTEDTINFKFKLLHRHYVPVGSVEFVSAFLKEFYGLTYKPINVPNDLIDTRWTFTHRYIFNGTDDDLKDLLGKWFVKSNDKIKGLAAVIGDDSNPLADPVVIPKGNYQISKYMTIESEWRCFVYDGKLVGLQNYSGEFTLFPNVNAIKKMISAYKSAPVAYTLDVGVSGVLTFVIEVHDFFSCGLYGFSNLAIYPNMLHRWFWQYIQKEMVNQHCNK